MTLKNKNTYQVLHLSHVLAGFALLASANQSYAYCFSEAAQKYQIPENLLRGIAQVESAGNYRAIGKIAKSGYDIGLMQINSGWLPKLKRYGITEKMLINNACQNVMVGAWILANHLKEAGYSWWGLGSYNASCKTKSKIQCQRARYGYANKVYKAMQYRKGKAFEISFNTSQALAISPEIKQEKELALNANFIATGPDMYSLERQETTIYRTNYASLPKKRISSFILDNSEEI